MLRTISLPEARNPAEVMKIQAESFDPGGKILRQNSRARRSSHGYFTDPKLTLPSLKNYFDKQEKFLDIPPKLPPKNFSTCASPALSAIEEKYEISKPSPKLRPKVKPANLFLGQSGSQNTTQNQNLNHRIVRAPYDRQILSRNVYNSCNSKLFQLENSLEEETDEMPSFATSTLSPKYLPVGEQLDVDRSDYDSVLHSAMNYVLCQHQNLPNIKTSSSFGSDSAPYFTFRMDKAIEPVRAKPCSVKINKHAENGGSKIYIDQKINRHNYSKKYRQNSRKSKSADSLSSHYRKHHAAGNEKQASSSRAQGLSLQRKDSRSLEQPSSTTGRSMPYDRFDKNEARLLSLCESRTTSHEQTMLTSLQVSEQHLNSKLKSYDTFNQHQHHRQKFQNNLDKFDSGGYQVRTARKSRHHSGSSSKASTIGMVRSFSLDPNKAKMYRYLHMSESERLKYEQQEEKLKKPLNLQKSYSMKNSRSVNVDKFEGNLSQFLRDTYQTKSLQKSETVPKIRPDSMLTNAKEPIEPNATGSKKHASATSKDASRHLSTPKICRSSRFMLSCSGSFKTEKRNSTEIQVDEADESLFGSLKRQRSFQKLQDKTKHMFRIMNLSNCKSYKQNYKNEHRQFKNHLGYDSNGVVLRKSSQMRSLRQKYKRSRTLLRPFSSEPFSDDDPEKEDQHNNSIDDPTDTSVNGLSNHSSLYSAIGHLGRKSFKDTLTAFSRNTKIYLSDLEKEVVEDKRLHDFLLMLMQEKINQQYKFQPAVTTTTASSDLNTRNSKNIGSGFTYTDMSDSHVSQTRLTQDCLNLPKLRLKHLLKNKEPNLPEIRLMHSCSTATDQSYKRYSHSTQEELHSLNDNQSSTLVEPRTESYSTNFSGVKELPGRLKSGNTITAVTNPDFVGTYRLEKQNGGSNSTILDVNNFDYDQFLA